MTRRQPAPLYSRFESRMGDLVAVVFLLMFCFGLLTFVVVVGISLIAEKVDGKIALGLLTFAASGATGFAATWRFMVLSRKREEETAPSSDELGDSGPPGSTSDERDFHNRHGYWPMSSNKDRPGRWGR